MSALFSTFNVWTKDNFDYDFYCVYEDNSALSHYYLRWNKNESFAWWAPEEKTGLDFDDLDFEQIQKLEQPNEIYFSRKKEENSIEEVFVIQKGQLTGEISKALTQFTFIGYGKNASNQEKISLTYSSCGDLRESPNTSAWRLRKLTIFMLSLPFLANLELN